jgi:hypothetical protein
MAQVAPAPRTAPFVLALRDAALARRDALVRLVGATGLEGSAILAGGRVAWATSRTLGVDLAAFLATAGVVDAAAAREVRRAALGPVGLDTVAARLAARHGVDRARFRELLSLHLRGALAALAAERAARPAVAAWSGVVDPSLTFAWDELFFELEGEAQVRPPPALEPRS